MTQTRWTQRYCGRSVHLEVNQQTLSDKDELVTHFVLGSDDSRLRTRSALVEASTFSRQGRQQERDLVFAAKSRNVWDS